MRGAERLSEFDTFNMRFYLGCPEKTAMIQISAVIQTTYCSQKLNCLRNGRGTKTDVRAA